MRDASGVKRRQSVVEADRFIIHRMVVGQCHHVHRPCLEDLDQLGTGTEVEALEQFLAALGEGALEVDERDVGGAEGRLDAGEVERPDLLLRNAPRQLTVDMRLQVRTQRGVAPNGKEYRRRWRGGRFACSLTGGLYARRRREPWKRQAGKKTRQA